jgi:hypothetical protein
MQGVTFCFASRLLKQQGHPDISRAQMPDRLAMAKSLDRKSYYDDTAIDLLVKRPTACCVLF